MASPGPAPTDDVAAPASGKPVAAPTASAEECDGQPPSETDNANYFCEYAYLYHQMDMLEDAHRTGTYFNAIVSNPSCFEGKVVLDVGAGSGILSIFAARAGAKIVYAVEATDMAVRAKKIVEANKLGEKIKVLQGTLETITLPCKVDVIVSEWMGYFLLRESMLDSVLIARDKHLKPGGSMFPSHATLYLSPLTQTKMLGSKMTQWEGEMQHWATFSQDMNSWYEADFSCVREEFIREQRQYYLQTGTFVNMTPKQLIGPAKPLLEIDLLTVSLEDLRAPAEPQTCTMRITRDGVVEGFCGYFDAFFRGSPSSPAEQETTLTTAPATGTSTHWGQQAFGFYPPLHAKRGDLIECSMRILRQERNHRLLRLETKFVHYGHQGAEKVMKAEREEVYFVD